MYENFIKLSKTSTHKKKQKTKITFDIPRRCVNRIDSQHRCCCDDDENMNEKR